MCRFNLILRFMLILLSKDIIVSSKDCIANIFYEYMYCLSSTSQCGQCISCYNDDIHGELYIPNGKQTAKQCNDTEDNICTNCKTKCKDTFNHNNYDQYINDVDTSCPTLSTFISEMDAKTLSFSKSIMNDNHIYNYICRNNDKISIKYGIIYNSNSLFSPECTLDISNQLISQCNEQSECRFDIKNNIQLPNCSNTYVAEIGSFCVSTHSETYNGNTFISTPENNNNMIIIISVLSAIIFIGIIIAIIASGICKKCKCKKPVSDSQRKLNKKPKRSERAQSDTNDIEGGAGNNNNMTPNSTYSGMEPVKEMDENIVNTLENPQMVPSYHTRMQSGNHSQQVNSTGYHPTHNNSARNRSRQYNRNQYTNMMHHQPLPRSNINNNTGGIDQAYQRQSMSYYEQHVVTTNDAHNRNTSVILDPNVMNQQPTQTRNSPYGSFSGATMNLQPKQPYMSSAIGTGAVDEYGYGHSLKSHPESILNRSDKIGFPFGVTNELQRDLMTAQQEEQKWDNSNVDVLYWNHYYGTQSNNNIHNNNNNHHNINANIMQRLNVDCDLTNPNGDVYDSTKIEVIGLGEMQLEAEIGKGCNSKVFKARWRNKEVAAKRFTVLDISKKKAREYIDNYASKITNSPHENVIKILAIVNKPFTLLTEYMNKGSVKNYVRRSRPGSTSISILDRIEIALQAAKGISHLHSLGIIHSEITSSNLLMELKESSQHRRRTGNRYNINDIRVVITDYAIQQMLSGDELETYRSSLGPLKWMAPELIENSGTKPTFESDIYAFGITMWEIITGQEPYPDVDPVDTAIYVCVKERRPQSYAFIPEKIQNLMKLCWHKNSKERPPAKDVVQKLTQFVTAETKKNNERDDLFE